MTLSDLTLAFVLSSLSLGSDDDLTITFGKQLLFSIRLRERRIFSAPRRLCSAGRDRPGEERQPILWCLPSLAEFRDLESDWRGSLITHPRSVTPRWFAGP